MNRALLALCLCAPLAAQDDPRARFEAAAIAALSRADDASLAALVAEAPWHAEALVQGLLRQSLDEGPDAWTLQAATAVAAAHHAHAGTAHLTDDVARRRAYDAAALAERLAVEVDGSAAHAAGAAGRFTEGAAHARRGAERARGLGHSLLEADLTRLLGQLLLDAGELDAARAALARARDLHAARGSTLGLADDELALARVARRAGQQRAALAHHEASLAWTAGTDVPPLADPLDLGGLYAWFGRYEEARLWLGRALETAGAPAPRARARMLLGSLESARGRYGAALRELADAAREARDAGAPRLLAEVLALRALVLSEVGRTADAQRDLDAADAALAALDVPLERAEVALARGLVHVDAGAAEAALAPLGAARAVFDEHGASASAARARQQEARALTVLGWLDEARAAWADAAARAEEGSDPLQRALAWTGLGAAYEALHDAPLARGAYRAALEAAAALETPEARWRARAGLGRLAARDDPRAALCALTAAADDLEDIRTALEAPALRLLFLEDKLEIFRAAARLAASLGRVEEAFRWSEATHARTLRERFAARDRDAPARALEPLLAEERALAALELRAAGARASGADAATRADFEARLASARAARERARLALELSAPALALSGRAPPVSPSAVAAALPARTALVAFTLGADDALALVVRAEGLEARALDATAPRVSALVARLHRPLDDLRNGTTDLANLGFDARAAEELHALLFAPLEDLLAGCDALLVVPDGPLWRVPLAALVRRRVPTRVDARRLYAQHARHEYLGDRYALGVLPSAGLLVAPRPPRPAGEGALVVADPVPLPHDAARLAGAAREARGAATRLAGAQLLAGRDASEAVVRARLERAGWLHFAVHASLDALHPEASRLALAPGAGHDGWLHAFEVERLSLGAEHVVLSACEGAGPAVAGEGFLGLARAFLAAGAPSVVASHWVVEDAAGGAFMDAFYAARARGARPLAALSAAQRAQRHGGPARVSYAHPFFWAGYTHVGLP